MNLQKLDEQILLKIVRNGDIRYGIIQEKSK